MYRLLQTPNSSWKKLLMMYYQVEVSEEFLNCADIQLTSYFENLTGLQVVFPMRISWDNSEPFEYERGNISCVNRVYLSLKNGMCKVQIVWRSKSGRIYEMSDKDIDCNDLEFWIEGLDAKLANHYWRPMWSLITFKDIYIEPFIKKHDLIFSKEFTTCMDNQLSFLFTQLTGIKINKEISLAWADERFFYNKDIVSSFASTLYVHHNWNPIIIKWKSKSERIYDVADVDIDCEDIEFWFDNLNIPLIHSQVYTKGTLPFKLKDLTYNLNVGNFSINCQFDLVLKKEHVGSAEDYMKSIDEFINGYNEKSEKQNRKNGVVHNWKHDVEGNVLIYELDLGSTGADFMKKLLMYFSEMNCFENVNIS